MGKKGFKKSSADLFMNLFSRGFFFDGYLLRTYKIKPVFSVMYMRFRFSVLLPFCWKKCFACANMKLTSNTEESCEDCFLKGFKDAESQSKTFKNHKQTYEKSHFILQTLKL
jgi:hypothetical protein